MPDETINPDVTAEAATAAETTEAVNAEQSAVPATEAPAAEGSAAEPPATGAAEPEQDKPAPSKHRARRQKSAVVTNPMTGLSTVDSVVTEDDSPELPSKVTLAAPYGYYDEENQLKFWPQGYVTENPDEIALLVERGAIFTSE